MLNEMKPGWYPYPRGSSTVRYFDGTQWTNEYRDRAPDGDQAPTTVSGSATRPVASTDVAPWAHWKKAMIKSYDKFDGRASAAECWWTLLINAGVVLVLFLLVVVGGEAWTILLVLYLLAMASPTIAVAVRRLHDTGKSGSYVLIGVIPIVGTVILLWLLAADADRKSNEYGQPLK